MLIGAVLYFTAAQESYVGGSQQWHSPRNVPVVLYADRPLLQTLPAICQWSLLLALMLYVVDVDSELMAMPPMLGCG